jgi:hypothetical protein
MEYFGDSCMEVMELPSGTSILAKHGVIMVKEERRQV